MPGFMFYLLCKSTARSNDPVWGYFFPLLADFCLNRKIFAGMQRFIQNRVYL